MQVNIESSWKQALKQEFDMPYFQQIVTHIKTELQAGHTIYPQGKNIFKAFELTPLADVKVVLLGQDPYHNPNQAMGLCFSVPSGIALPHSLINIYKELHSDIGVLPSKNGDLASWAQQGVLLLNSALTVRKNEPASHSKIGWTTFTDAVIKTISDQKQGVVFLLWGKYAQEKVVLIDDTKHEVLKAAHPSPFSADKGFFGCKHFSKTNQLLTRQGKSPINWKIND